MTRVTFGWGNLHLRWSPDGQKLTFSSNRSGVFNLNQKAADGSGEAERLSPSDQTQILGASWSPDGQNFVMIEPGESSPAPTKLNLIINWSEELKRLVPLN